MSADSNKVSEDIENAKVTQRVTFAENVVGHEPAITPSFAAKKHPNYSRMRKDVFRCVKEGKYEEIKTYLQYHQEMEAFYKKEGRSIFSWALINALNAEPLNYLVNEIPSSIAIEMLTRNNFSVLTDFLGGHKLMEKYGSSTKVGVDTVVEKLNIILKMNN